MEEISLDGNNLSIEALAAVARQDLTVSLSPKVAERIKKARRIIEEAVEKRKIVYGVTTGFGALSSVVLSKEQTKDLQRNILLSHSAGVGNPFDEETTRAIMALRINSLAKGYSGIRLKTLETMVEMVNKGVLPVIPEKGSVGASGDLAPLAHMGLVMIGEGKAFYHGTCLEGKEAMRRAGIPPLLLEEGEGLAIINGTQVMTAIGAMTVYDSINLMKAADIAAGMTMEVLMGSNIQLDQKIHDVRPHPGQSLCAENLRRLTAGSNIITSHKDYTRVQDAYTIRCCPQVHGASRDALEYAKKVILTEMNSATDNPLVFYETGEILTGGNFHGQPVGFATDFLAIALSELADISERRVERLVNPQLSGLPAFLIKDPGLNSGLMLAQYTAAALVSENKTLCHPASVDSIPTSANKEDHVSMGTIAARKCREVLKNAQYVTAIELLCAAQALDLFTNLKPGHGTLEAYKLIREHVPHMERDRVLSKDIETLYHLVQSGAIVACVEKKIGRLN
ncbi:MAG: histidine ammonia-lyase [Candidatus Brocadiales bacterium]|nr:histidine ammonia-lyase [Candidatus Brocadiales bacterium]